LLKKLTGAVNKIQEHSAVLEELEATCGPEQVAKWTQLVDSWQLDHSVKPDPYQEYTEGAPSYLPDRYGPLMYLITQKQHLHRWRYYGRSLLGKKQRKLSVRGPSRKVSR
jgi:hypothetical protein